MYLRRPLISPARLNLTGQRLKLFAEHHAVHQRPIKSAPKVRPTPNPSEDANVCSTNLVQDATQLSPHSHVYSSSMGGRLQPTNFSAVRTMRCSLRMSCLVAEPNQTMMEKMRTDSMTEAKSVEGGSMYSEATDRRKDSSSRSSACVVDTTTNVVSHQETDGGGGWKGFCGNILWKSLLGLSVTSNVVFVSVYIYQSLY
ncbi:transmembrane protein 201-like [Rhinoraja longicauda]